MGNAYIILTITFFILILILHLLTSRRFSLGRKVLKNNLTMQSTFSSIGANGSDCIKFLQSTLPHKPFKLIKIKKYTEGSFQHIGRRMKIDESFDKPCAESVIDGAHEFAHALQVGDYWFLCYILLFSSFLSLLVMIWAGALLGISTQLLASATIFIITFNAGSTSLEIDALISSLSLSKFYLKHKGLNDRDMLEFINFAESKIKAAAVWYLFANFATL
ncbi:MAG: hypothetical protein PWP72_942 [Thermoanaerobacter sp.]|nr:hypothetical protein [Thermoanaerobacter sp.]